MDFNKIDFTNKNQKMFAVFLIVGFLFFAKWILPPVIEIMKNIYLAAALFIPLAFLVWRRDMVWSMAKQLSWNLTKYWVSKNKIPMMYQYLDYLNAKTERLGKSILTVSGMETKIRRKIVELNENYKGNIYQHQNLKERGGSPNALNALKSKIDTDKRHIDKLIPQADGILRNKNYLVQLHDIWVNDNEALKYKIDGMADEYETMKEIASATGNAQEFLKGNSEEYKIYQETLRQMEVDVSNYAANIESFERRAAPIIEMASANKAMSEEEGQRLIDEYNAKRTEVKFIEA